MGFTGLKSITSSNWLSIFEFVINQQPKKISQCHFDRLPLIVFIEQL